LKRSRNMLAGPSTNPEPGRIGNPVDDENGDEMNSTLSGTRRNRSFLSRFYACLGLLPALGLVSGCVSYSQANLEIRDEIARGHFEKALHRIDASDKERNRLLSLLEKGQITHYSGQWEQSNSFFEEAEKLSRALYTKSLSAEGLALITNDRTLAYRAAPYEMAMIPYYRAFNYLALGKANEAVVEARKAGELLKKSVEALEQEIEPERSESTDFLRSDPFLLYFSGLLYEIVGQDNDAFIAYRNALRAYTVVGNQLGIAAGPWLGSDILRVGRRLGFFSEIESMKREYPGVFPDDGQPQSGPRAGIGTVAVFVESGWVPARREIRLDFPIFDSDHYSRVEDWAEHVAARIGPYSSNGGIRYWITVALPQLEPDSSPPISGTIRVHPDGASAGLFPVDALETRARQEFDLVYPKILVRTLIRALVKYGISEAARKEDENLGMIVNLFGMLTERADTRSWLSLPGEISILRLDLPPGQYDLDLEFRDTSGRIIGGETLVGVHIEEGRWCLFNRRVF